MKIYHGVHKNGQYSVDVDGQNLNSRLDLINHSPDGFSWGYEGSGPAQLALAILADCKGDAFALRFYQLFKRDVIAKLGRSLSWEISEEFIDDWVRRRFMAICTVYYNPSDYPNKYVVRILNFPTDEIYVEDSLEAIRKHIPLDLYRQPRVQNDDPVIIENWF